MPKAPHSFAENYFSNVITDMRIAGVLTVAEANSRMRTTVDIHLPTHHWIPLPGTLGPCDIKVAHVAFGSSRGRPFPFVVIEAGFSEPYDHPTKKGLLQDARHWLEQSRGEVKCVVLVSIDENKEFIKRPSTGDNAGDYDQKMEGDGLARVGEHDQEGDMQDEQEREIDGYELGESDTDESVSAQSDGSSGSSAKAYKASYKRFTSSPELVAQYAGPFTAFIEVWRYDKQRKQMVQSGNRTVRPPI